MSGASTPGVRSWNRPRPRSVDLLRRRVRPQPRFPTEVIVVAVRWYPRFNLSYRDVEELLVERGAEVDHVTVYRWVQRFTPLPADAARFCRHAPGHRWHVDETYVKVNGVWRYVYRAVDQYGQIIDVLVSARRDADAARRFFQRALRMLKVVPGEVVTDAAGVYPAVLDELIPSAWHHVEQYANKLSHQLASIPAMIAWMLSGSLRTRLCSWKASSNRRDTYFARRRRADRFSGWGTGRPPGQPRRAAAGAASVASARRSRRRSSP
jgi:transposase-like protein